NKPMKLIVTSSPGGPTDVLARPIAEKMGEILGRAAALELVAVCGYMTLLTNVLKVTKCSLSDGSVDVV
ncbi:MAG: hypothetical protein M0Q54_01975, partial [Pigmentiphaga sp.]|nr:hypothetical protein [Pigmentiphaga sp.]